MRWEDKVYEICARISTDKDSKTRAALIEELLQLFEENQPDVDGRVDLGAA
jgi:hypothetical protein